ncbi:MAG: hypothetical protein ACUVX8_12650 [Candidatus Zipacnadales bacterium]
MCLPRPRSASTIAGLVLGLWAVVLLGPLGLGSGLVHHHEVGALQNSCLTCVLLQAVSVTVPSQPLLLTAPAELGTLDLLPPLSLPVADYYSPFHPRSPPESLVT